MDAIFFLIRLPFFLIGVLILVAIPVILCALVIGLAPCVLPLAIVVWLLVLVLVFIYAALANRSDILTSFFKETGKWITNLWKEFVPSIDDYLKSYERLFNWLIGSDKEAS